MKFIEHDPVDIEAVFAVCLGGKHLIEGVGRDVHDAFLRGQDLHPLVQGGTHPHHIGGDIEYDRSLLSVGSAAVDLGTFLAVTAGEQQGNRSGKLGLSVLLRNFDVCRVELPVAVGLQNAEQVTNDALLPVDQLERLSSPCAFRMGKALDEPDCVVGGGFVVMGILRHELGRCIIFQLSQVPHLHEKGGRR